MKLEEQRSRSEESRSAFRADVLAGLAQLQKRIPGKYLWDDRGSELFGQVSASPSYYPSQRETPLLQRAAGDIALRLGRGCSVIDIGSGGSPKAEIVLDGLAEPRAYLAVDISGEAAARLAERLGVRCGLQEARSLCADYARPMAPLPAELRVAALGLFLGTSVCNMAPKESIELLGRLRSFLGESHLLLGADPNQNQDALQKAYGSEAMGAFHLNLIARMARELDSSLLGADFSHEVRIQRRPCRVEAHVVARRPLRGMVAQRPVRFERGESILTDVSYKHSSTQMLQLAASGGWAPVVLWPDEDDLFCLYLLRPAQA